MAGLDKYMMNLIKNLAKNQIQEAKNAALVCLSNDTTKKNQPQVEYYKKLIEHGTINMFEIPINLKGLLNVEDVGDFREDRFFVGKTQNELYDDIIIGTKVTEKMMYYGIPYRNSTLIYGEPGTGKTEFAKYVAYKLGLPYAYVNFSYLIDSYMGNTSKNLQKVFDFCKGQPCVLMLDEIDCIGLKRGHDTGADGELGRTTIALMQCLDDLVDGQIVIAATNRFDRLDPALRRRFRRKVEFVRFDIDEELEMITRFIDSIDIIEMDQDMIDFSTKHCTQAETIDYLTKRVGEKVLENILEDDKEPGGNQWEK